MNHRFLLALFVIANLAGVLLAEAQKPNVLFIAVDDLRTELGCYGAAHVASPNIDRLASEGVLFERAYCQFALCSPSRTSLMTGMRPEHVGVLGNHTHFRDRFPQVATLPQHFREHGYRSVGVGKLYHGPFPKGASKTTWDTMGDFPSWSEPPIRFGPQYYFSEQAVRYAKQAYLEQYDVTNAQPDDWTKKLVFGYLTDAPEGPDNLHYDGKVTDAAIDKLHQLQEEPFFLAVGFIKPHSPWVAPKKYFDLYDRDAIPLAANGDFPAGTPPLAGHNSSEPRRYPPAPAQGPFSEDVARELRHGYFACVSFIDAQIGRLLSELKDLGLDENTIIILWGDHGYHLGEQSMWGKSTCFENAARVPLIIRVPGQKHRGAKTSALAELVDLYPTLCELADLPAPLQLDGTSLVGVVNEPDAAGKTAAFSQYPRGRAMGYSVRTDHYRFTRWLGLKDHSVVADELYDHQVDPLETRNLASSATHQEVVAKHAEILKRHRESTAKRSVAAAKPVAVQTTGLEQPIRVACVGDSITFGAGIADREQNSYPVKLQQLLGNQWQVSNFGYSGATLLKKGHKPYWEKPPFQESLNFQPDVVVINLGANDVTNRNWMHRADFVSDYRALIETYRNLDSHPQVYICDILPMTPRHQRYDECMPNRRELRPLVWEVAADLNVPIIDLNVPFRGRAERLPDGLHPDGRGASIMAGHVLATLTGSKVPPEPVEEPISEMGLVTSFEKCSPGPLDEVATAVGKWTAESGHAEIDKQHSHRGQHCLHLFGGETRTVEFVPATTDKPWNRLRFWSERWTSRSPFSFHIDALSDGKWSRVFDGDNKIQVGRFPTQVSVPVRSTGVERLRFVCTSPASSGLLIDDVALVTAAEAPPLSVRSEDYVAPLLVGDHPGPLRRIRIDVEPTDGEVAVVEFQATLGGALSQQEIDQVHVFHTEDHRLRARESPSCFANATHFASVIPAKKMVFRGNQKLTAGTHYFWIAATLKPTADVDSNLSAECAKVVFADGKQIEPDVDEQPRPQRLGVAVRRSGDDGVHTFRIPGLARTNEGALIAVYDVRRRSGGDLPGDIDIGMSRSADGGRTWEPMQVIMDMGDSPKWNFDGIGDPSVLVDKATNTIWVAAIWSHGNRGWFGSQPGMQPAETGQFMLVRSDDDGRTWSEPINITSQLKDPEWSFLLQGPGKGITMRDGTLVFPAQYQDTLANERLPRSTIIYSRDHGASWQIGTGAFDDTTESQVVEIEPGLLMLNCRYNREPHRVVMTTNDMGQTWNVHPTSRKALVEPGACMASLIDVGQEIGGGDSWLLFSNPNRRRGRSHITIKASLDKGMTWNTAHQILLDEGRGAGYSCMAMIDEETVGILYEGSQAHMVFQRVKLRDLVPPETGPNRQSEDLPKKSEANPSPGQRLNILLIVSEDNGPELGCYGDRYARTPHLNQLAAEGVLFANASVTYSVCSPSRASIFTGLYPHQNGQIGLATHKFSMFGEIPNMVSLLKDAGYRTGIIGKIHVNPESAFPCDFRAFPGSNFNDRPVERFAEEAADFFSAGDPFFLMVNFPDAHFPLLRQQYGLPKEPLTADDVKPLPWVGVDSARLRKFTADYYNCLSRLDTGVGMLLEKLSERRLDDQTLVIYLGDHGAQFSRGKTSVYEAGLRIPLIVRDPSHTEAGVVRDELVSTVDLLPTVLDYAGVSRPQSLPGHSLRPLLEGRTIPWRDYAYAFSSGGAPTLYFPQFSVRDKRYKLIASPVRDRDNACAHAYSSRHNVHFAAGCSPKEIQSAGPGVQDVYDRYLRPPPLELYDLQADPNEFNNLAGKTEYQDEKNRLLAALTSWRKRTNEPLVRPNILERLTAEHDTAKGTGYRKDQHFRWHYLDYFSHAMDVN